MLTQSQAYGQTKQCPLCHKWHHPHCKGYQRKSSFFILLAAILILLATVPVLAESSQPQHSVNLSGIACSANGAGYVDFHVWSWANESPKGDNPSILVQYQIETSDGFVTGYTDYMTGTFGIENHYRFGSTIYMTGDVKRVAIIVTAVGEWGDGIQGGQMSYMELFPIDCDSTTGLPVDGEPLTPRVWIPNIQKSAMIPWLLLAMPVVLMGSGKEQE